ncbi:MAG: DUF2723 domain-containing protein [Chitinophagales bacterium]|nr:DUF2723 domain-containing protein [Chitinophagales bacterium]
MRTYKLLNNIVGWFIFLVALVTYTMTLEATASFWDCGEFISGCDKEQVVHPPGAPLFLLIGRLFILFAPNVAQKAWMVNFLSGLTSAFAVLFLFWITTHYARKLVFGKREPNFGEILTVLVTGTIAGLSCTFLDTIWFSAVEGEVYAMSLFFMMMVFWCMTKWEDASPDYKMRWLVLCMFLLGISSGVHLLSFLAIPAMALIYYFNSYKPTVGGIIITLVVGFIVLGFFFKGVVNGIIEGICAFELFFTNTLSLPFGTGFIVFMLAIAGMLGVALYLSQTKKNLRVAEWLLIALLVGFAGFSANSTMIWVVLLLAGGGAIYYFNSTGRTQLVSRATSQAILLSGLMVVVGFSTYAIVIIRANADTPINMNNPSDAFTLKSYLNREQYGSRPLTYGPHYDAEVTDADKDGDYFTVKSYKYHQGEKKYEKIGENIDYEFASSDMMLFPRMGSWQDPGHVNAYRAMVQPDFRVVDGEGNEVKYFSNTGDWNTAYKQAEAFANGQSEQKLRVKDVIGQKENLKFFFSYQIGFMYWRYFFWNFSGRQNDSQGRFNNNDGNWVTGFSFIDDALIGPQKNLPAEMKNNAAHNVYYMIPFILGLIGVMYHFKKDPESAGVVMALFLFGGLLQIVYLNSPPYEPRERDYTLVASFVTYCLWIGFAVLAIVDWLKKIPTTAAAAVALVICLPAPLLMATQNWDDHDRSYKTTARDFAINYLESCAPNAIIFTQGDNDTYPLWYAQEVEGIRSDVRVVNLSLLGVDWYIKQLGLKANEAPAVKLIHTPDKYLGSNRDMVRYYNGKNLAPGTFVELKDVVGFIASENMSEKVEMSNKEWVNYLPTRDFNITVNKGAVQSLKMVAPDKDSLVVDNMRWSLESSKTSLLKNDLITLDIVASNIWERPIYFAVSVSPDAYLGLDKYFQLEGLAYRIVPVESKGTDQRNTGTVATDVMFNNMMNKFKWGGMEKKDTISYTLKQNETLEQAAYKHNTTPSQIKQFNGGKDIKGGSTIKLIVPHPFFMDENALRMTMNVRANFARLARTLIEQGRPQDAEKLLDYSMYVMPQENVPFNYFVADYPELYYKIGAREKAALYARKLAEMYEHELIFAADQKDYSPDFITTIRNAYYITNQMKEVAKQNQDKATEDEVAARMKRMEPIAQQYLMMPN